MDEKLTKKFLFPHSEARPVQEDLISDAAAAAAERKSLIAHAPTGLGKTAATISPCLAEAMKSSATIFFLTSRHTQHQIALDTLRSIKEKYSLDFSAVSIIGRKWMCAMPETSSMYSKDFISFCKAMRDDNKCEFYANLGTRAKPSIECKKAADALSRVSPVDTKRIISICSREKVCPYEMALIAASSAKVIVTDYFYIIDPYIREIFLRKIGKKLEDSILIFDEAHNLPARTRDLMTTRISSFILDRAVKEAHKYRLEEAEFFLREIKSAVEKLASDLAEGQEKLVKKESFAEAVGKIKDYDEILAALEFAADDVREKERASYIGSAALFMKLWQGDDEGYVRFASKTPSKYGTVTTIVYRCLDPAIFTKEVMASARSVILMSGTLTPTSMYRDLMGMPENAVEKTYPSPFPQGNRLVLIVPKTTTKFTQRSEKQFSEIAQSCAEIINAVPGSSAAFFPSYSIMKNVAEKLSPICNKIIFREERGMSKEQKHDFLEEFKLKKGKAVLLGVAAGSFGEGIDLPGNILKGVIVVGLPLEKPTLETKELISYYDKKFSRGWDYGYIMPAITKSLQNAGRCIRSESDKGVLVFLDQRYSWPSYIQCFPDEWDIKVTVDYLEKINEFFKYTNK